MRGRWRLFRHEAARESGPGPWAFLAIYVVALAIGTLSTMTFGLVVFWPANAVMIAALLVLKRRPALFVLGIGIALNVANNLIRGDQMPFFLINIVMNTAEAVLAAVIARRVCGAALDLRRPSRLWRFSLLAVTPAVLVAVSVSIPLAVLLRDYSLEQTLFQIQRFLVVEALGALILTPALILLSRRPPGDLRQQDRERGSLLLMALLFVTTAAVFLQARAPLVFMIFPVLVLVSFRLSPSRVALSVIGVALIGGTATASGLGPMTLADLPDIPALFGFGGITANLNLYYLFMLMVVLTALPLSTHTTRKRQLNARLRARTEAAQLARARAERSEATRSRFLALMSHEMRTPLNSISGYAEVLALRPDLATGDRQAIDRIHSAGAALLGLVEDVLEMSGQDEAVHLAPVRLDVIMASALSPHRVAASEKGLSVTVDVRPDAAIPLVGDARRMRQALQPLIGNAVKFTDRGGVTIRADRLDGEVLIAVTDTGMGLDPQKADSLFEAFVQGDDSITRCHGGAGIGLAVARRHATLMGGDIGVDSHPGEGATFTLRLPMAVAPDTAGQQPADSGDPAAGQASIPVADQTPLHVLVVDDHPANREVVRLMLTAMGCRVDQAGDGGEAVRMAGTGLYDLILMDVRMPKVDGLSATRSIRALPGIPGQVPILALTADAMPEDAARCLAAGMDGHLAKPVALTALGEALAQVLGGVGDPDRRNVSSAA